MAAAGVHISVIAAMVGHRDGGALLLRRYRHLFPHEQKAPAAAFERLVVRGGVAQGSQAAASSARQLAKRFNNAMGGAGNRTTDLLLVRSDVGLDERAPEVARLSGNRRSRSRFPMLARSPRLQAIPASLGTRTSLVPNTPLTAMVAGEVGRCSLTLPCAVSVSRRVHPGPKGRESRTPRTFPCITACSRDRGK
jgi:hypothetical protein